MKNFSLNLSALFVIFSLFFSTFALTLLSLPKTADAAINPTLLGFRANEGGGGKLDIGWTGGNLGNTWAEGEWVPYKLVLEKVQESYPGLDGLVIEVSYDFTNGGYRFSDLVRGFQVSETTDLADDEGWPKSDNTGAFSITNRNEIEIAQNDGFGIWGGFNLLSPSAVNVALDGGVGTPTDAKRKFVIDKDDLTSAGIATTTNTIVIYWQLHESRTFVWSNSLQGQYAGNPAGEWGGEYYDDAPFVTDQRNGSSFVPGSSGHINIIGDLGGNQDVPIPIPDDISGFISGYKWSDDDADGVKDDAESFLEGWRITVTGVIEQISFTATTSTGADGSYMFPSLTAGTTWTVSEESRDTFEETYPNNSSANVGVASKTTDVPGGEAPYGWDVNLTINSPTQDNVNFGNRLALGNIIIKKETLPDGSGELFDFTTDYGAGSFSLSDGQSNLAEDLPADVYSVSEDTPDGWDLTSATCDDGSDPSAIDLSAGETVTCTFTNTKLPTLTLEKTVINNNGGTSVVGDFQAYIDGGEVLWGEPKTVSVGDHVASEDELPGYLASVWGGDCSTNGSITLAPGENKVCTITNDDIAPELTIIKHVVNDNGGTAIASSWTMNVTATNPSSTGFSGDESGVTITLDAGNYSVDESGGVAGYEKTLGNNCSGSIDIGEKKTCIITNNDIPPTVTLTKEIDDTFGGTALPDDFLLTIGGESATSGVSKEVMANTPYALSETLLDGYEFVSLTGDNGCPAELGGTVTLAPGGNIECTITNKSLPASVSGYKFNDLNGNGSWDDGEPAIPGWTINLSGDALDSVVTDENGYYEFTDLASGNYTIAEEVQAGWMATTDISYDEALSNGVSKTDVNFGNFELFEISGKKFNDLNSDGVRTDGTTDPNIEGWLIRLDLVDSSEAPHCESGKTPVASVNGEYCEVLTDSYGNYSFVNLGPGEYVVSEGTQAGWSQTAPTASSGLGATDEGTYEVVGESGTNRANRNFGNFKFGIISGHKFNDLNGNGSWDDGEPAIPGWTINLSGDDTGSAVTDENGYYEFSDLNLGTYSVNEGQQEGWTQTTDNPASVEVTSGTDSKDNNFGNFKDVTIVAYKFNDINGDGEKDDTDTPIEGWEIKLNGDAKFTDENGKVSWVVTSGGDYTVEEILQEGWTNTNDVSQVITVSSGDTDKEVVFLNFQNVEVVAYKYEDMNGNGFKDPEDTPIQGWEIKLNGDAKFTDENGKVSWSVTTAGPYTISEEVRDGWIATSPASANVEVTSGNVSPGLVEFLNFKLGTIIIHKDVVAPDGSNVDDLHEFAVYLDGSNEKTVSEGSDVTYSGLEAGSYVITEGDDPNYDLVSLDSSPVEVTSGAEKHVYIVNKQHVSKIIVIKHVVNNNGGTKEADDFIMIVDAVSPSINNFPGEEDPGTAVEVFAGDYGVDEGNHDGYTRSLSDDCSGTIGVGEIKTCTITNDDIAPELTIIKHVVNDNGGEAVPTDWLLEADGPTLISGNGGVESGADFVAGTYTLSESSSVEGYEASDWVCIGDGIQDGNQITLGVGESATCTITNDDIPATIIIVKDAIPNDLKDFTFNIVGGSLDETFYLDDDEGVVYDVGNNDLDNKIEFEILAGTYTITEQSENFWNVTDIVCIDKDTEEEIDTGVNGGSVEVPVGFGQVVECTFVNQKDNPSRTQGFWKTHTEFTSNVFSGTGIDTEFAPGFTDSEMILGSGGEGSQTIISNLEELFGAYYANVAKTTKKGKDGRRSKEDQARIQLAHQLITAKLNCRAFGCTGDVLGLIQDGDDAYSSSGAGFMIEAMGALDEYNNSGDTLIISPPLPAPGKATPKDSSELANTDTGGGETGLEFWNEFFQD